MSTNTPYFFIKDVPSASEYFVVCHNCDGRVSFMATKHVDEETHRLLQLALAEGERRITKKLRDLLGV